MVKYIITEETRQKLIASHIIHGRSYDKIYKAWDSMKQRCFNPKCKQYKFYGNRGVTVCERWLNFNNFALDMGEPPTNKHSIDRFPDKNGNYEPGNCRWATNKQQQNNIKTNVILEYQGKSQTVSQWAEEVNIKCTTLFERLKRGWSIEKTLTTPLMRNRYG